MFVVHPTLEPRHMQFFAETTATVMRRATESSPAAQRRAA
jgi:hypothetical protein